MIIEWIHTALTYIGDHPNFGLVFSFLISFAESFPIVGTIIPGSFTMTAVGTLVGIGVLPLFPTLICASIGAFCGDLGGYALGLLGEGKLAHIWPFKYALNWVEYGKDFFRKHGGKSIVIGRFFGPIRSTVPLIASLLGLPFGRFVVAAIPSAILWAIVYTGPGILIGHYSMHIQVKDIGKFIAIGIASVVAFAAIVWIASFICSRIKALFLWRMEPFWLKFKVTNNIYYRALKISAEPNNPLGLTLLWMLIAWIVITCNSVVIPNNIYHQLIVLPLLHFTDPILAHHTVHKLVLCFIKANTLFHLSLIAFVTVVFSFCCLSKPFAKRWSLIYALLIVVIFLVATHGFTHYPPSYLLPMLQTFILGAPYIITTYLRPSRYLVYRRIADLILLLWIIITGILLCITHMIAFKTLVISWSAGSTILYLLLFMTYRSRSIELTHRLDSICLMFPIFTVIILSFC